MNQPLTQNPELLISQNLLYKIYRLCQVNHSVEWSGVLFYKILEGSVQNPTTFKLEAVDLFLMDIGNATYTEYEFDNDVVKYLCDNSQYMEKDYAIGHIHSHNTMSVFFSGTDVQELKDNAPNHNFYLSLIVNNLNAMCAKIAINEEIQLSKKVDNQWVPYETKHNVVDYDCNIKLQSDSMFETRLNLIKNKVKPVQVPTDFKNTWVSENKSLHGKYKQLSFLPPITTDDSIFTKDEVIKYLNLLLGNVYKSTKENLVAFAAMNEEQSKRAFHNILTTYESKFQNLFPSESILLIDDMLELIREELLDFEKVLPIALEIVHYLDTNILPRHYDNNN